MTDRASLPKLLVAPTGATRQKSDHPMLPISVEESIDAARTCFAAGADGIHLHLRHPDGRHLLDADLYKEAVAKMNAAVPDMAVQITTEAAGIYEAPFQMQLVRDVKPALVSCAWRELSRIEDDAALTAFYDETWQDGIAVQHILYEADELPKLLAVLPDYQRHDPRLQLIFVLGRYSVGQNSGPEDLDPFLDALRAHDLTPDWMVCAFGAGETAALTYAYERGGKCRVGFENSLWNADGSVAKDNAARVQEVCASIAKGS